MLEIGAGVPGSNRPLRRDVYKPIPGDIFFEDRVLGGTAYIPRGAPWYRTGKDAVEPVWNVTDILPSGFEPSIVVSKKVEIFGKFQGVVMVAVSLRRLSQTLDALDMAEGSRAFVIERTTWFWRPPAPMMASSPLISPTIHEPTRLPAPVARADVDGKRDEYRTQVDTSALGPVFVSSSALPFRNGVC